MLDYVGGLLDDGGTFVQMFVVVVVLAHVVARYLRRYLIAPYPAPGSKRGRAQASEQRGSPFRREPLAQPERLTAFDFACLSGAARRAAIATLRHRGVISIGPGGRLERGSAPLPEDANEVERWFCELAERGGTLDSMWRHTPLDDARAARLRRFGFLPSDREQTIGRLGALVPLLGVWGFGASRVLVDAMVYPWVLTLAWPVLVLFVMGCSMLATWVSWRMGSRFGPRSSAAVRLVRSAHALPEHTDAREWPPPEASREQIELAAALYGSVAVADYGRVTLAGSGPPLRIDVDALLGSIAPVDPRLLASAPRRRLLALALTGLVAVGLALLPALVVESPPMPLVFAPSSEAADPALVRLPAPKRSSTPPCSRAEDDDGVLSTLARAPRPPMPAIASDQPQMAVDPTTIYAVDEHAIVELSFVDGAVSLGEVHRPQVAVPRERVERLLDEPPRLVSPWIEGVAVDERGWLWLSADERLLLCHLEGELCRIWGILPVGVGPLSLLPAGVERGEDRDGEGDLPNMAEGAPVGWTLVGTRMRTGEGLELPRVMPSGPLADVLVEALERYELCGRPRGPHAPHRSIGAPTRLADGRTIGAIGRPGQSAPELALLDGDDLGVKQILMALPNASRWSLVEAGGVLLGLSSTGTIARIELEAGELTTLETTVHHWQGVAMQPRVASPAAGP